MEGKNEIFLIITSLHRIRGCVTDENILNNFFISFHSPPLTFLSFFFPILDLRILRRTTMANYTRIPDLSVAAVHHIDDRRNEKFALCPHLFQRLRTAGRHRVLATVRHLSGQCGRAG